MRSYQPSGTVGLPKITDEDLKHQFTAAGIDFDDDDDPEAMMNDPGVMKDMLRHIQAG